MKLTGKVWKYGRDVNTDDIIPARFLYTSDPKELATHCMEDFEPGFLGKIKPGDIIVAAENFGCGSSREHAPIALKEAGIACVVAKSFARIFYRNAINIGLPIFEAPEAADGSREGDTIEIDAARGTITNRATGREYRAAPLPAFMQEIIASGGLISYVQKKVKAGA